MARAIRIEGRAKYFVVGLVLLLLLGNWLAPSLLSQAVGSSGRGLSFFRSGYVEQHKTNLTGHWIGTAKGAYKTGFVLASKGERIVIDHDIEVREGGFALRLRRYDWTTLPDFVWSEWIREDRQGRLTIEVPETGLYDLHLSYFSFAGSIVLNWDIQDAQAGQ